MSWTEDLLGVYHFLVRKHLSELREIPAFPYFEALHEGTHNAFLTTSPHQRTFHVADNSVTSVTI